MSLASDIQAALEKHQPMTAAWVIAFETTELDGDGDIGGAWGVAFNASQVTAIGLLDLATQAVRNPEEDA